LHTHGLGRCGVAELEMLDVPPEGSGLCAKLLNAVAAQFVEHGMPPPGEPFDAGMNLTLVWFPWEQALKHVRPGCLGAEADRDEGHRGASAVLLVPRRGWLWTSYEGPASYLPLLQGNPILYVSAMETERQSMLAKEHLPDFVELFGRHGASPDWHFIVKLGYRVDGAADGLAREHLWFEVHALEGASCSATLMNEPLQVRALKAGHRGSHDLGLLSDWQIFCPHGRFGPDTLSLLRAKLAGAAPA
jgi:hypothetical protein